LFRARTSPDRKQNGMTKRAQKLIDQTYGLRIKDNPAIASLVEFAAQNSGLDFANYGDRTAYRAEARSINQDWRRFKSALAIAATEGVTDKEVIAEAPHAFSGRLEWVDKDYLRKNHDMNTDYQRQGWNYTTGQYFPTEYRKAAATLLEYATRVVRQSRPKQTIPKINSIADLKRLNEQNGGCWFDRSNTRFFNTRIESGILRGKYFVSSEQYDDNTPRKFTLRSFDETGSVDTVGEFQAHSTKADAIAAIPQTEMEVV